MVELVSKTYANALFEVAMENGNYEKVKDELYFIIECLDKEPKLYDILKSPLISAEEKKSIISLVFKDTISKEVFNLLQIIIDKRREKYIEGIVHEYKALIDRVQNQVDAVAITAVPMSQEDLEKLQLNLSKSSGKNIQLQNQVDPSVVGGVLVKIGDKIIDGTVKNRLANIREQLSQILV